MECTGNQTQNFSNCRLAQHNKHTGRNLCSSAYFLFIYFYRSFLSQIFWLTSSYALPLITFPPTHPILLMIFFSSQARARACFLLHLLVTALPSRILSETSTSLGSNQTKHNAFQAEPCLRNK